MAATPRRKYDIIVFGATGYTGKLTSQAVLEFTPSTLTWAIAGRSPQKLELLAHEYNRLHPDRKPVEIFISDLSEFSVEKLAGATRLLISTVGPFIKYGTPVIEACAVYGTHYVDSTGEFPWVYEMIKRCHKTAQKRGAILVPQCGGFESAPIDLGTYALVKTIRDELGEATGDVRFALHDVRGSVSHGTFETSMTVFDTATLQELHEATQPYALSPVKGIDQPTQYPMRRDPDLGILTSWANDTADRSQVFRSWGLIDGGAFYGRNFVWKEYMRVSNWISAVFWMIVLNLGVVLLILGPFRWIIRKMNRVAPGEGPSEESRRNHYVEWRGVAEVDDDSENPRKAHVNVRFDGDPYELTGRMMVVIAMAILFDPNTLARKLGGGLLTPACLATPQLFRELDRAGLKIETKLL
ncbi:hypothetical protein EDC01DRAFT_624956 [Geopyxis carbonaria]|nr:hypothetical protein EDC01DRAFT_624956 [Geopyxis carbonaria]